MTVPDGAIGGSPRAEASPGAGGSERRAGPPPTPPDDTAAAAEREDRTHPGATDPAEGVPAPGSAGGGRRAPDAAASTRASGAPATQAAQPQRSGSSPDRTRPGATDPGAPDPAVLEATDGRPDDRDLPLDGHLHTVMSPDADVAIDTYATAAVARGIREIAITDHVDFDPSAPAYAYADLAMRERYVREAAERWAERGVTIRFGIEITYQSRYEAEIREHLARGPYDHAIGSVHVMRGDPYTKERVAAWVAGRSFSGIVAPYFAEVLAAARSGLFDVVGHLDFVKRYLAPHVPPAAFAAAPEIYEPILRALVDSGTGLEVNTSGLRQPAQETYPAPWAVARFRELGGTRVTIGSDAHLARSFASGLGRGYEAAAAAGFMTVELGGRDGTTRAGGDRAHMNPRAGRSRAG